MSIVMFRRICVWCTSILYLQVRPDDRWQLLLHRTTGHCPRHNGRRPMHTSHTRSYMRTHTHTRTHTWHAHLWTHVRTHARTHEWMLPREVVIVFV